MHLLYVWLRSPDLAIRRVRRRVREGGHDVPADVIRRRYHRGIANFIEGYRPLADRWRVYDNSATGLPMLIAQGGRAAPTIVHQAHAWRRIMKEHDDGRKEHI